MEVRPFPNRLLKPIAEWRRRSRFPSKMTLVHARTLFCIVKFLVLVVVLLSLGCCKGERVIKRKKNQICLRECNWKLLKYLALRGLSKSQNWPTRPVILKWNISKYVFSLTFYLTHLLCIHHLEIIWSRWIVLINIGILLTTGLVWPASSDFWKSLCVIFFKFYFSSFL